MNFFLKCTDKQCMKCSGFERSRILLFVQNETEACGWSKRETLSFPAKSSELQGGDAGLRKKVVGKLFYMFWVQVWGDTCFFQSKHWCLIQDVELDIMRKVILDIEIWIWKSSKLKQQNSEEGEKVTLGWISEKEFSYFSFLRKNYFGKNIDSKTSFCTVDGQVIFFFYLMWFQSLMANVSK